MSSQGREEAFCPADSAAAVAAVGAPALQHFQTVVMQAARGEDLQHTRILTTIFLCTQRCFFGWGGYIALQ
jgi:hypothetical protein